jgi:hypothetical protein
MTSRRIAVCTTLTVSLLALASSTAARTSSRPTSKKPAATAPASRGWSSARLGASRSAAVRGKTACASCAANVAQKGRRTARKKTATAKNLPCHPKNYVDPKIARNYTGAMRDMRRARINPQVTSVWRSSDHQAQLHRCSLSTRCRRTNPGLYGALPPGRSLHEAGFAVDIAGVASGPRGNKRLTPKGRRIVSIMRKNGFSWRYGLKDPAHFEADPTRHGYRNARHAIRKTQTTCQVSLAKSRAHKKPAGKVALNRSTSTARSRAAAVAAKPRRQVVKVRA